MKQDGRPITVEEHKELERKHAEKKQTAVNDALKFPTGNDFEEDLDGILSSDAEANGEVVAIALIDCDKFMHINEDFGREAGDRFLVSAGEYIRDSLPEGAKVYRIGGDEFGIIFRGTTEREEIFLFLNDPEPAVMLLKCADSGMDFAVRVWVKTADYWPVSFRLLDNGKRALDRAGITIPFPQMDVHVKS